MREAGGMEAPLTHRSPPPPGRDPGIVEAALLRFIPRSMPRIQARPEVEALSPYVAPLEGRRGKLRLDFNENTVGPSPRVLEAIRALGPEELATYPEYAGLHESFAAHCGVAVGQVHAFNGADGAIRAVFDAYGMPGTTFLTTSPTFGYYGPCAAQQGMKTVGIPYPEDLSFPHTAFEAALADSPRLAFICNPNNPTGTWLDPARVLQLARSAPDTLFAVDEIYARFAGGSVLPDALGHDNVVVLRSLSKTHGIAALRMGFAVGAQDVVQRLSRVVGPYDLNMFAVRAAQAALADDAHVEAYVQEVLRARELTYQQLEARGIRHARSHANYLLMWPPGELSSVVEGLRARDVLVRSMAGKPVVGGSLRLTIGTREQMQRFFAVLDEVLG